MHVKSDLKITGTATSEIISLRNDLNPFNVSVMLSIPSATTGNIRLEFTGKLDFPNALDKDFKIHSEMDDIDLSLTQDKMFFVNILSPCSAIRFKTISASEILNLNIIQSGNIAGVSA